MYFLLNIGDIPDSYASLPEGFPHFSLGKGWKVIDSQGLVLVGEYVIVSRAGYMGMGFSLPFPMITGCPNFFRVSVVFFQCRKTGTNHMEDHPNDL